MEEELREIERNHTWELATLPHNKRPIGVKWVYKVKVKSTGEIANYEARLVAKGFLQNAGLDYNVVFALVARIETIRLVVASTTFRGWSLHQLDVKSALLNCPLEEEVHVDQPPTFKVTRHEDKVYKLKRALYGLRKALQTWNKRTNHILLQLGFRNCTEKYGIYVRATI